MPILKDEKERTETKRSDETEGTSIATSITDQKEDIATNLEHKLQQIDTQTSFGGIPQTPKGSCDIFDIVRFAQNLLGIYELWNQNPLSSQNLFNDEFDCLGYYIYAERKTTSDDHCSISNSNQCPRTVFLKSLDIIKDNLISVDNEITEQLNHIVQSAEKKDITAYYKQIFQFNTAVREKIGSIELMESEKAQNISEYLLGNYKKMLLIGKKDDSLKNLLSSFNLFISRSDLTFDGKALFNSDYEISYGDAWWDLEFSNEDLYNRIVFTLADACNRPDWKSTYSLNLNENGTSPDLGVMENVGGFSQDKTTTSDPRLNQINRMIDIPQGISINEDGFGICWDDIIGNDIAKQVFAEKIYIPLINPALDNCFGKKGYGSQGLLLYGPSGTGKTQLAKALASNLNNSCFIEVANLNSPYFSESETNVQKIFSFARDKLKENKNVILFVDEADRIIGRGNNAYTSNVETRIISTFKSELDSTASNNYTDEDGITYKIFFILASNHKDVKEVDEALFRPGRFEETETTLPEYNERTKAFELYLKECKTLDPTLDIHEISQDLSLRTEGFNLSYADISVGILTDTLKRSIYKNICGGVVDINNLDILKNIDPDTDIRTKVTRELLYEVVDNYLAKEKGHTSDSKRPSIYT